jgi:PAT family beta-lactamase induction signal transducer AmpG
LPPEVDRSAPSLSQARARSSDVIATFFRKEGVLLAVLVILLYRLTEGQLVRIVPLFLLDSRDIGGLGLSTAELGGIYGTLGNIALMSGTLLGGYIGSRLGMRRTLTVFCILFNLPALVYWLLAVYRPESLLLVQAAILSEQLACGVGTIGLKLVMMQLANGQYETAHLAFTTGIAGLAITFGGMGSGLLQARLGYEAFFGCVLVASLCAIAVAFLYSRRPEQV